MTHFAYITHVLARFGLCSLIYKYCTYAGQKPKKRDEYLPTHPLSARSRLLLVFSDFTDARHRFTR